MQDPGGKFYFKRCPVVSGPCQSDLCFLIKVMGTRPGLACTWALGSRTPFCHLPPCTSSPRKHRAPSPLDLEQNSITWRVPQCNTMSTLVLILKKVNSLSGILTRCLGSVESLLYMVNLGNSQIGESYTNADQLWTSSSSLKSEVHRFLRCKEWAQSDVKEVFCFLVIFFPQIPTDRILVTYGYG